VTTEKHIDVETEPFNPADRFATPQQVVDDLRLAADQKRRALQQWKQDARALAVADEDGMAGVKETMLRSVMNALESVCNAKAEDRAANTNYRI
jgi:hypothetical protein